VAIAAGYYHSLALRADGTVVAWGDNYYGQTNVPAGLTNAVAIAAGYYHSLALRADGTVVAWGKNGSGQTTVPAGLTSAVAIAAGDYHTLALIGNSRPFLNSRLIGQLVFSGSTVFFRADAFGTLPLTYQWQCNGTNLLGATNSVLTLPMVQQSQSGNYQFIVTNVSGSVTSSVALLTVINEAPSINSQPNNQTNMTGAIANFTITASGSVPVSYQWRKDGINLVNNGRISGVSSIGLTITNLQSSDAGNYTVVVTNAFGSVTSSVATLLITIGVLDTSFDLSGIVNNAVKSLIVQPDHKLLVVNGNMIRLNSDGSTDGSFSQTTGGACMALQNDGKILFGGWFTSVNGVGRNYIARLNGDGTLDTSFLSGLSSSGGGLAAPVQSVALLPNGQVLIGGTFTSISGIARGNLARLNSNGTLDTNFLSGLSGTGNSGPVCAIVVQPDGKILVGGYFTNFNSTPRNLLARLNSDGTLDASFQDGLAGYWSEYLNVSSLALKPDGKIVVGGYFYVGANSSVAQLNPNGTLDTSFYTDLDASVSAVAVRSDGKIYIGGQFTIVNGMARNHIARLNANGTIDTGFLNGLSGATGSGYPFVYAIALDTGKVYIGGNFTYVNGLSRPYLARLFDDLPVSAPTISAQPPSREVPIGATVSFGVTSTGNETLYYQWRKNGTNLVDAGNLSGVTTTNLTISSVQTNDAGNYTVVVTNAYGSVTSSVAVLSISPMELVVTLADYYPLPLGADWLYDGTDWDGNPAKTRYQVVSVNRNITLYTGHSPAASYTTNCVDVFAGYLDRTTLAAYDTWDEYMANGGRFGQFGDDDLPDESLRVDGGAIYPAQMAVGSSATSIADAYLSGTFAGVMTNVLQVVERTSLTVPAGYFPDVLHVRMSIAMPGNSQVHDEWWARSVGKIKRAGISGGGAALNYELIQYSVPLPPAPPIIHFDDGSKGIVSNKFGFNITGSSNLVIVVEASTNLTNWLPVSTNTLNTFIGTNGSSYFSDSQWTNYHGRFYRLRSP
jgi:uncharacterized delta-60 repeat protein